MDDYLSFEQIPFGSDSFANNPEPRCPCVLLLDTSGSMAGKPLDELNAGIQVFKKELMRDSLACKRVEIAMVTFGPVTVQSHFETVPNFHPKELNTTGDTPMGEAILMGIDLVAQRKKVYKENGIAYYKPWIILITDGSPTDEYAEAAEKIIVGENAKAFAFFAIGVEGADFNILNKIAARKPLKLKGLLFREFFIWLSASMKMVSVKEIGSTINLIPPIGWAEL